MYEPCFLSPTTQNTSYTPCREGLPHKLIIDPNLLSRDRDLSQKVVKQWNLDFDSSTSLAFHSANFTPELRTFVQQGLFRAQVSHLEVNFQGEFVLAPA